MGAILLAGAVVRVVLWVLWSGQPIQIVDAQDYHRLAVGLVETGSYITPSGAPSSLRPPFYPWFVAQLYEVFGTGNEAAVRAAQALLSLITVVVVYRLGALLYCDRIGVVAAAMTCFYPSLLGFNNLILSETLFTLLLVSSTWILAEAHQKQSIGLLVVGGIALGVASLTRSIMLLSVPFLTAFVLATWNGRLHKRLLAAAALAAAVVVIITPWAIRNTRIQQTFTLVDVMGGRNAMMGNYEYTPLERSWATVSTVTGERSWDAVLRRKRPEVVGMTQGQLDRAAMRYGIHFALSNPALTAKRDVVRFFNFWQLERTLLAGAHQQLWGPVPKAGILSLAIIICGSYAAVMFLGIMGMAVMPPANRSFFWLLILSILIPCLIHTVIFAHSRYHLPLMPLVILPAAAAWSRRKELWARRAGWQFKLGIVCCTILTLGWVREIIFVDLAFASQIIP